MDSGYYESLELFCFAVIKMEVGFFVHTNKTEWLICPICKNKTRTKARSDTTLTNFPLFCPKCKNEILVNVKQQKISVVEQDAKTQNR